MLYLIRPYLHLGKTPVSTRIDFNHFEKYVCSCVKLNYICWSPVYCHLLTMFGKIFARAKLIVDLWILLDPHHDPTPHAIMVALVKPNFTRQCFKKTIALAIVLLNTEASLCHSSLESFSRLVILLLNYILNQLHFNTCFPS